MRNVLVYIITKVPDTLSWGFKYGKTLKIHPPKAPTHRHTQRRQTGISFRQDVGQVLTTESQNLWRPPQEGGTVSLTRFTFKKTKRVPLKWNFFIYMRQFPAQSPQVRFVQRASLASRLELLQSISSCWETTKIPFFVSVPTWVCLLWCVEMACDTVLCI